MSEGNSGTGLKRREVMRRGAVATGALVVGGTAMTGSSAAEHGSFDPCNVRIKGVDDCDGKDNENALKQGGRRATAYVGNCPAQEERNLVWEVVAETDHGELCPEPNGNPRVRCYEMLQCAHGVTRVFCVKGSLPIGSFWQVTEAEEC